VVFCGYHGNREPGGKYATYTVRFMTKTYGLTAYETEVRPIGIPLPT